MQISETLDEFLVQWKCTPEEREQIILYLTIIRIQTVIRNLSSYRENYYRNHYFGFDGDGI